MRNLFSILAVTLCFLLTGPGLAQTTDQRVALVIGNAAYKSGPLANPVNDARAMAARLRSFGFDVMLKENLKTREIGSTYREFRTKIKPGTTALVFYAGHGIQVKGQNYFPAIDAEIDSEEDVPLQSLNLGTLLENMEEAKAGVSLVFLDACRDNPFARRFRSASRGLAKVEAASGTLIHYATRPGSVAADGDGKNGTYTEALLTQLNSPLPVELMLKQVTNTVVAKTKGKQEPWIEGSLRGDFYFNGRVPVASEPAGNDRAFWDSVKDSRYPDEFRAYLDQYPRGLFAALAQTRLKALQSTQVASVVPNIAATRPQAVPGALASMTRGTVFRDCADCPEMVVIPAGSFTMGSSSSETGRFDDEGPQHLVRIASPFAAGKFEVTFDEWDACVRDRGCTQNPSDQGRGRGKRPVINVSWEDAKSYTQWLSRRTGKSYRLLTEAEWEYVARAGTTTAFSFGNRISPQQASYATTNSYAGSSVATTPRNTVTVGSYAPNAFGLYDVHGNVWEWSEDCYNANYNGAPSDGTAWMSGDCGRRVLRGGAWIVNPQILRSAYRNNVNPSGRFNFIGFRLARTD